MIQTDTLKSLETVLETFLDKVVLLKEKRLSVLEGISSLDEISAKSNNRLEINDQLGDWFAQHSQWLTENNLKDNDINRINNMLSSIKEKISDSDKISPADRKIQTEIDRWDQKLRPAAQKLTLIRKSENQYVQTQPETDTISLFISKLSKLTTLFMDYSTNKMHILSILNDLLNSAIVQKNKDALILSGFIIYYLKQNGYKVGPYVKKLKEAETSQSKRTL